MMDLISEHIATWTGARIVKPKGGRGRGRGTNGQSPHGIKKLRELILELAVRGKLVPQDPNDEPASVLLGKIAKEKARLIKEGKIKKQKTLPKLSEDEKPYLLPNGWEWSRFGEIGIVGSSSRVHQKDWTDNGIPFLRAREIVKLSKFGTVDNELFITEKLYKTLSNNGILPESDDLMITGVGTIGVPYIVNPTDKFYFKDASVLIFKNYFKLFPPFLYCLLTTPYWNNLIHENSMGTTVHTLTISRAKEVPVPFPPVSEQHRIVAKVDELMALCDKLEQQQTDSNDTHQTLVETLLTTLTTSADPAEFTLSWQRIAAHFDTLFTTEESIDQLKQNILQLAVMGKLVPQKPNDEPASTLLEKIAKEKARLIKEGKIKKQKPLPKISDDEKLFVLPDGWEWSRLQEVIDVRDGTHDSPKDAVGSDTYPLVTSKNFQNGTIRFDEARRISAEDHFNISKRSFVERDDILFSMIGGNLGNQVMVDDDQPFSVKNVALFKYYNKELTTPVFIKKFMEHLALDLQSKAAGGAQPFVSLGFLRKLVIALPPIAEQHRIVAKVDEIMALCDTLKERLHDAQTTQVQLADAIVEQAVA